MAANTCVAPPGPRTAAEARREFACTADPPRRRLPQSPSQGVLYGQLALTDCIAEGPDLAEGRSPGLPAIASAAAGALTVDVFIGRGDALRAYRITVERTA